MTEAEQKLWSALRRRQMHGFKFRRQHPLGNYIVDFVCIEAKVVIEVDGGQHQGQKSYDAERDSWLRKQEYTVTRFWNNEVLEQFDVVKEKIWESLSEIAPPSQPSPCEGEGVK